MKLTAGQQIIIQDSLYLPSSCGVPAYVHAYQGPCPPDKYTEGFSQQSATGQYTYDNSGNLGYDPNKKVTYYYNFLNLPYKITGSENDETQFLYGADGSLLQRKYIKNSVQISKRDYLRDKEIVDNLMESIMHSDGRVIKSGNNWNFEYHIKDHLGNVRVTFSDNNGNGLLVGDEIRSRNDYYPFGLEWNNHWELGDTISPINLKRFNGKELLTDMDLNLLFFENRLLNIELDRFNTVDKLSWHPNQVDKSPYSAMWNNPFRYNDPDGNYPGNPWYYLIEGFRQYAQAAGAVVDKILPKYEIEIHNKTSLVSETKVDNIKNSTSVNISESYAKIKTGSVEESFKYNTSPIDVEIAVNEKSIENKTTVEKKVRGVNLYANNKTYIDKKGIKNTTTAGAKVEIGGKDSRIEGYGEGFGSFTNKGNMSFGAKLGTDAITSKKISSANTTTKVETRSGGSFSAYWSWFIK